MAVVSALASPALFVLHGPSAPRGLPADAASKVLPAGLVPIGRKVAELVPAVSDAAGGFMLLVASGDRATGDLPGVLNSTWAALVLLEDAAGNVTIRAVRGAQFVAACDAAQLDIGEARRVGGAGISKAAAVVAAAESGAGFATSQAPVELKGDRKVLAVWGAERARALVNSAGVSLLDGGFSPPVPMARFSASGWFEASPAPPLPQRVVVVDGVVTSPDVLRARAETLQQEVRSLEQSSRRAASSAGVAHCRVGHCARALIRLWTSRRVLGSQSGG